MFSFFLLLIQVNFLLTSSLLRSEKDASPSRAMPLSDIQLYKDLAHVSGGQTIEITDTTLSQVTALITDAITADLVISNNSLYTQF